MSKLETLKQTYARYARGEITRKQGARELGKGVQAHTHGAAQKTRPDDAPTKQGERTDLRNLRKSQSERAQGNGVGKRTQEKLDRLARDFPALLEEVQQGKLSVCPPYRGRGSTQSLTV